MARYAREADGGPSPARRRAFVFVGGGARHFPTRQFPTGHWGEACNVFGARHLLEPGNLEVGAAGRIRGDGGPAMA
jgi:hypothetical protein